MTPLWYNFLLYALVYNTAAFMMGVPAALILKGDMDNAALVFIVANVFGISLGYFLVTKEYRAMLWAGLAFFYAIIISNAFFIDASASAASNLFWRIIFLFATFGSNYLLYLQCKENNHSNKE